MSDVFKEISLGQGQSKIADLIDLAERHLPDVVQEMPSSLRATQDGKNARVKVVVAARVSPKKYKFFFHEKDFDLLLVGLEDSEDTWLIDKESLMMAGRGLFTISTPGNSSAGSGFLEIRQFKLQLKRFEMLHEVSRDQIVEEPGKSKKPTQRGLVEAGRPARMQRGGMAEAMVAENRVAAAANRVRRESRTEKTRLDKLATKRALIANRLEREGFERLETDSDFALVYSDVTAVVGASAPINKFDWDLGDGRTMHFKISSPYQGRLDRAFFNAPESLARHEWLVVAVRGGAEGWLIPMSVFKQYMDSWPKRPGGLNPNLVAGAIDGRDYLWTSDSLGLGRLPLDDFKISRALERAHGSSSSLEVLAPAVTSEEVGVVLRKRLRARKAQIHPVSPDDVEPADENEVIRGR